MAELGRDTLADRAKRYSNIKYCLSIIDVIYLVLLLFLFQGLGLSEVLAGWLSKSIINIYFVIPVYIAIIYIAYCLFDFPLNFYQTLILERKFCLSNQKIKDWFKEQIKIGLISYIIALILTEAFYYILRHYIHIWWLIISLFWIFFSVILARLIPVIIIPLFFKYKRLSDDSLRQRVMHLADKMKINPVRKSRAGKTKFSNGVKILDCFEIDFSKKTLKANAAFVGWGATKRVILADTLKDKYSFDEIEVILAHEFAHYKLRHLLKLILTNSLAAVICFYLIFKTSSYALALSGVSSLSDIAALPTLLIYFVLFGIIMQPFANFISRRLERNADRLALKVTGLKQAFISMMEKLATQNLADRNPHPLIKFFFFDHPGVDERIAMASSFSPSTTDIRDTQ